MSNFRFQLSFWHEPWDVRTAETPLNDSQDKYLPYPVVLVYLGAKLPNYVFKTISWIENYTPQQEIILICNESASIRLSRKLSGIQVTTIEELNTEAHSSLQTVRNEINNWQFKDKKFWQFAIERIFWLDIWYSRNRNRYGGFIHFESDCIPLCNLAILKPLFHSESEFVRFPRQNENEGCASVVLVKGGYQWDYLMSSFRDNFSAKQGTTDMYLLSEALKMSVPGITELPRIPNEGSPLFFDPVTYGPFFLGHDARHNRFAFSTRERAQGRPGSIAVQHCNWKINFSQGNIVIKDLEFKSTLFNLHLHNKKIPKCNLIGRFALFLRLRFHHLLPDYRFDSLVFLERFLSKINRLTNPNSGDIRLR